MKTPILLLVLVASFTQTVPAAHARGPVCEDRDLNEAMVKVRRTLRYASGMKRNTAEDIQDWRKLASGAETSNRVATSVAVGSAAVVATLATLAATGGGAVGWLTALEASEVTGLVAPGALLGVAIQGSVQQYMNKVQASAARVCQQLRFQPTRDEMVRTPPMLNPRDVRDAVFEFLDRVIDQSEADLNSEATAYLAAYDGEGDGVLGRTAVEVTQLNLSIAEARYDLFSVHEKVLGNLEADLARTCRNVSRLVDGTY